MIGDAYTLSYCISSFALLLFSVLVTYIIFLGINHYNPMQIELYGGLFLFCGFILFDTQLIVEKCERGDNDYIWHSLDLFLDFVNIFCRLLIILASKVRPILYVYST